MPTRSNKTWAQWYITPDSVDFSYVDSLNVTDITPQNNALAGHNPVYGIGTGGNPTLFEIVSGSDTLAFKAAPTSTGVYNANVTAAGGTVFEDGNNHRMVQVTVSSIPIDPDSFLTTWKTTSAGQTIKIPVEVHSGKNFTINWGDGSTADTVTSNGVQSHTYATAGSYRVTMTGDLSRINLGGSDSTPISLHSINQWGDIPWSTMNNAFRGASDMTYNATDAPDLSDVTIMQNMFRDAEKFNGDLSGWNTSSATNMSYMFNGADAFNGDLSGWDVSSVTDMTAMFWNAAAFNGDISTWNTSSATNISFMFNDAAAFNGDISTWNTSSATNTSFMFNDAAAFNQDISVWDVSSATNMNFMFDGASSFDQNLGPWHIVLDNDSIDLGDADTTIGGISAQNSALAGQSGAYGIGQNHDSDMFEINDASLDVKADADYTARTEYTINITSNHPYGTNNHRLVGVTVFNSSAAFVTTWETTTPGESITIPATGSYVIDWGDGTAESVTGPKTHTYADAGNHTVTITGGLTSINLGADPDNAAKLVSIDQWGNITWTTMEGAFRDAFSMVYNATDEPDLSGVTNMTNMFRGASAFNGNVLGWDVSGVTDMKNMFSGASAFNGNVSGWDVSRVTDMANMFQYASDFNQNISGWDVSGVTDMANMFGGAVDFNGNVSGWNVSGVTDMANMFGSASDFNQDLSGWNVSGVTDMSGMFWGAAKVQLGPVGMERLGHDQDVQHVPRRLGLQRRRLRLGRLGRD